MATSLIIFGLALFLGTMLFSILLSTKPKIVKIVRPLICPPGTEMEVEIFSASYPDPGGRGITIQAVGPEGRQDVKGRALIILWAVCCLVCAIPSAILVILIMRQIALLAL